MAEKYTIQIQPQITSADSAKMERDLNRRFANVSKKFGHGLNNALKSSAKFGAKALKGGLIGAGVALAGAIMTNPFEKVNEDLNNTLEKLDNIATRAGQFGVSAGKFRRAEEVFGAFGVQNLDPILARFATFQEKARTGEDKSLQNYINKDEDIIDSLVAFSTSLRQMSPEERNASVEQIFGERYGLKIAEALQEDLAAKAKQFSKFSEKAINDVVAKGAKNEEIQATERQKLETESLVRKGNLIGKGTVRTQAEFERSKLAKELQQLSQYEIYAQQKILEEKSLAVLEDIKSSILGEITPILRTIAEYVRKALEWASEIARSIKKIQFWK